MCRVHFFVDLFELMNITTCIDSHIRIIVPCQCKHATEKSVKNRTWSNVDEYGGEEDDLLWSHRVQRQHRVATNTGDDGRQAAKG